MEADRTWPAFFPKTDLLASAVPNSSVSRKAKIVRSCFDKTVDHPASDVVGQHAGSSRVKLAAVVAVLPEEGGELVVDLLCGRIPRPPQIVREVMELGNQRVDLFVGIASVRHGAWFFSP